MVLFRLIFESFNFALQALVSNRTRSVLSLLGISIGIIAIVSVFTVIDSLEIKIKDSLKSLGENVIYVQKWSWEFGADYPWWKYMNRPHPSISEMDRLATLSDRAEAVSFVVTSNNKTIKFRNNSIENSTIVAASGNYEKIKSFELEEGRYFSPSELLNGRDNIVIGADIASNLFPFESSLGKKISVLGRKLTIIGVFKKEGESIVGNSSDNTVIIPINFARNILDIRSDRVQPTIMVKGKANVSNIELKDELHGLMRSLRKLKPLEPDDFSLNEVSLLSTRLDSLFAIIELAGLVIGGFSLVVGGFGIANIMFVSVKERTHIIGIQKSLGAKNYFILLQFLIESVLLSLSGGIIGLIVIFAGTVASTYIFDFKIVLSVSNIILGISVSGIIGIIAGFIPAYRGANMNPVEAIRLT